MRNMQRYKKIDILLNSNNELIMKILFVMHYYDVNTGFTGVDKLYHKLKNKGVTKKKLNHF